MELDDLRKVMRGELSDILDSTTERKDLVIDPDLTKALDRIAGVSFLKEHGIDKIYKLDPIQKSLPGRNKRIYIVRSSMLNMKHIADHILTERRLGEQREYTVALVPRMLHVCESVLEDEGVFGLVAVRELQLDLFVLDSDFMSMEMPFLFRSFYLDEDYTYLHTIASSLVKLQRLYGRIPNIHTVGKLSKMAYDMMMSMLEYDNTLSSNFHICQLYIVDRDVDYITPLCSPMSYEAMLDDTFSIDCGVLELKPEIVKKSESAKILLSSSDPIYADIRDLHISSVFPYLSVKAKELQNISQRQSGLKTVDDMKSFVSQDLKYLMQQQSTLSYHISACEYIVQSKKQDFEMYIQTEHDILMGTHAKSCFSNIEDCLHRQVSSSDCFRLMCLMSLVQEGFQKRDYRRLRATFLHSHGFEHLVSFFSLKKLGLLLDQDWYRNMHSSINQHHVQFKQLSSKLALFPKTAADINLKCPTDISYVFSGAYSPLLVRLIERIMQQVAWQPLDDIRRMIPGGIFSDLNYKAAEVGGANGASFAPATQNSEHSALVFFIGGCSLAEVAALRMIARRDNLQITIATTGILSSHRLLDLICGRCQCRDIR